MPDAPLTVSPLWARRLQAHANEDAGFFNEARKRDGRAIPYEHIEQERDPIDSEHDGRKGKMTGRMKSTYVTSNARALVPQTRSVGATAEMRAANSRVNNSAFSRLKAESSAEQYDRATNRSKKLAAAN